MTIKREAYYLLIGFFCFIVKPSSGQNQKVADSLKKIYQQGNLSDSAKLELLRGMAFNERSNNKLGIKYAEELIKLSEQKKNNLYLYRGYFLKGNHERLLGNLPEALDAYIKSGEISSKDNNSKGEANAYGAIANTYYLQKNHPNARLYHTKAIAVLRQSTDSIALASAILNAGEEFRTNQIYDTALLYFNEAGKIFEKINYEIGKAYTLGNTGLILYAQKGQNDSALIHFKEAIRILEVSGNFSPICDFLIPMSDIYLQKGDKKTAMSYAMKSLKLAEKLGLKEQISNANLKLSELYEKAGNPGESFSYYKHYTAYRDSMNNIESVKKMADLRTDYEVSQKQVEVDLLHQQRKNQQIIVIATVIALFLIFLLAILLYRRNVFIRKTNQIIQEEKNRSDNLLLNILPEETAFELKKSGKVKAQKFESVTVLFTDFKEFTHYAESLSPEKVVEAVDFYFSKFDKIIEKYELEKIKTIGDSYMCAGGLPFPIKNHAFKMVEAALEIAAFVTDSKKQNPENEVRFDIRIGIHTGPVVAGVVGSKKFAYDIWGDTVNIASRMESGSDPGKINISENTFQLVSDFFDCEYRGEIQVKNRGTMKMYFVNKIKENRAI
jgi:adenylate cyclase